jgi:hypothetical protein
VVTVVAAHLHTSLAYLLIGAVALGAAPARAGAIGICLARVVAVDEVRALPLVAATRVALEVEVAGVIEELLPLYALVTVHALMHRAAQRRVQALIIVVAVDASVPLLVIGVRGVTSLL